MKLPSLYLSVWGKKKRKGFVFTFVSCFQFGSLQLCIHLCQTTSACIPTSQRQAPAAELQPRASRQPAQPCVWLPGAFSQLELVSRCAPLYKTPLSLFLSRSRSSCVRCIHPSLALSPSVSISLFFSLSHPPRSLSLTKKHLMCVLMSLLGYCPHSPLLPPLSLSVWLPPLSFLGSAAAAHCCFCLPSLVCLFVCAAHLAATPSAFSPRATTTTRHGCKGRKVEVPPQSYFLPTWILRPLLSALTTKPAQDYPEAFAKAVFLTSIMVSVHGVSQAWPQKSKPHFQLNCKHTVDFICSATLWEFVCWHYDSPAAEHVTSVKWVDMVVRATEVQIATHSSPVFPTDCQNAHYTYQPLDCINVGSHVTSNTHSHSEWYRTHS